MHTTLLIFFSQLRCTACRVPLRCTQALEDLYVHYDATVRNAAGGIVQFAYGDDGLDPVVMEGKDGRPLDFERLLAKVWLHMAWYVAPAVWLHMAWHVAPAVWLHMAWHVAPAVWLHMAWHIAPAV
jgi:hypothetical protein